MPRRKRRPSERLAKLLEEMFEGRSGCISRAKLLAETKMLPSELEEAIRELVKQGIVFEDNDRVCYTGAIVGDAYLVDELIPLIEKKHFKVYDVRGIIKGVDLVAVPDKYARLRGKDYGVAVKPLGGKIPPERIVHAAVEAARAARRISENWRELLTTAKPPALLIPVVVLRRGAPRLVEGVLVLPLESFKRLLDDPTPYLSDPTVRVYHVSQ